MDGTLSTVTRAGDGAILRIESAALVVEVGPDLDRVHRLSEHPAIVGRGETADFRLADPSISREHLVIRRDGARWVLRDLGSRNGSRLDGVRVDSAPLEEGARITLGDTTLRFTGAPEEYRLASPGPRSLEGLVGSSEVMTDLLAMVEKIAPLELPVMLLGETGTGKEALAQALHRRGANPGGPWCVVDCTLLRDPVLMRSELFGHREGAFTGAGRDRVGAFVRAHGGTLFLDEVGELPLELQAQLLRVLQEGEVKALGAEEAARVRVRVVAATHRDLAARVGAGTFREDLYFRLSALTLEVPPLRARGDDVLLLAEHFLPEGATLAVPARDALLAHPWPGNVRELENVIRRAGALAKGGLIAFEDLGLDHAAAHPEGERPVASARRRSRDITDEEILAALRRTGGNRAEAARFLGMARRTLYNRLAKLEGPGE